MILLIIPLALLGLLAWWRPIFALGALSLLFPSYLWRWTIGGIPTTFLELALYATALGVLVALLMRRIAWARLEWTRATWILVSLWSIAWIVATVVSPDIRAGAGALKAWWFDGLLYAGLVATIVRTDSERAAWIQSITLSGTIVAAAGLYQMVFLRSTAHDGRLSSFYVPVANYAAMYIAPILVFTVAALTQRRMRLSWWWFAGVMAVALLATVSYGGYIAAAAGAVTIWYALPASRWKKTLLWAGVIGAIVGVVALSTTKNFGQHFDAGRSSGKVREQIWVTSWALVRQHPLVGIGPNQFEVAYRQEIPKHYFPPLEWLVSQPHQLWLAVWLEGGAVAVLTLLVGLGYALVMLWRLLRIPVHRVPSLMSLAALVTIIVHGFVDTPILKNDLVLLTTAILMLPFVGRGSTQKTN